MPAHAPYDDPGIPDARGPARYLWWLVWRQRGRVLLGALWGSSWMVSLMLPPYLISRAVDDGLRSDNARALIGWAVAVVAVGVLNAVLGLLRHRTMTFVRTDASCRTVQVVTRHAVRLGAVLPRVMSTGEVVSIGSADIQRISQALTITGPGVGAVIAYAVVTVLLLEVSPLLGAVVVLGVPFLAILLGPLLNRLQGAETVYREHQGALTARVGDIVSGLRVLCGIGGKPLFAQRYHHASAALRDEGYRVGAVTSWIQALSVGLPGVFVAVLTWLAARMAASGEITIGDLVAVYGYVAVLVGPVGFFIEGAGDVGRGLVAARRVVRLMSLRPAVDNTDQGEAGPSDDAVLRDPSSGLDVPPGVMSAIVTAVPADAVALVDRLGRYVDSGVEWGGVRLSAVALAEVRRRILVGDNDAHLFAGALRDAVATHDERDGAAVTAAVHTAAAEDVVAGLPDGLDSHLEAQGRNLSGGQRQRLRLARALLADPEVLLLVEPTSAVDAHTEVLVAARTHAARRGRTTVVVTTSPLVLDQVEQVAYLVDGRVAATGTHAELLTTQPGYRTLVYRGADEGPPPLTQATVSTSASTG
ncbi:ABC transporter transmembrane domain-containing protein [Actinopolymorpha pittospori]